MASTRLKLMMNLVPKKTGSAENRKENGDGFALDGKRLSIAR